MMLLQNLEQGATVLEQNVPWNSLSQDISQHPFKTGFLSILQYFI